MVRPLLQPAFPMLSALALRSRISRESVRGGFGDRIGAFYDAPAKGPAEPADQDVQIHAYRRADGRGSGS